MRLALVIVAALATPALAQPADPPFLVKRPEVGTGLAIGVTAAGVGALYLAFRDDKANLTGVEAMLMAGGFYTTLFGPSSGHVYAREKKHASMMFGFRCGAAVLLLGGWMKWNAEGPEDAGKAEMWIGGSALAVLTLYDLFDAHRAVHRFNRRNNPPAPLLQPTLTKSRGVTVPGIAIAATF